MPVCFWKTFCRLVAFIFMFLVPVAVSAQVAPSVKEAPGLEPPPRWNLFIGYSFLSPHGSVDSSPDLQDKNLPASYHHVTLGGDFSYSYFLGRHLGLTGEMGLHEWGIQNSNPTGMDGTHGNNDGFTTVAGGVVLRDVHGQWTPFFHVLGGGALVDGPAHNMFTWGEVMSGGAGLDYNTPLFHRRLALRLFQVDYEYMHVDFGNNSSGQPIGGSVGINALRLSTGIVFPPTPALPLPLTLECTPSPAVVFPGDPVTVTALAGNLNSKLNANYSWSGAGVTGNGMTASVATGSLAPGTHTVICGVKEGKPGKEGLQPGQTADASATFTVKPFEPPTISCSANPSTIKPGEPSTITSIGLSPQNRPLTFGYNSTVGTISGRGATAVFDSAGAPTGGVGITCTATDDKGQAAAAATGITITAPYVPPVPHTQSLCSIGFATDKQRPTRVDNEAKACLDEVALDLQKQSDAKVVVVGTATAKEKAKMAKEQKAALKNKHIKVEDFAAQRAVNTKDYLVTEKGIDPSRVIVAISTADDQRVEDYLVPAGANFSAEVAGTKPVDESAVKAETRKPLPAMHTVSKKKAADPKKS
jgi:hypothetical protein